MSYMITIGRWQIISKHSFTKSDIFKCLSPLPLTVNHCPSVSWLWSNVWAPMSGPNNIFTQTVMISEAEEGMDSVSSTPTTEHWSGSLSHIVSLSCSTHLVHSSIKQLKTILTHGHHWSLVSCWSYQETPCYTLLHLMTLSLLIWGVWRRMICTFNWLYNELMTVNGEHFPSSGRVDDVSKNAYEYSSTTIFILNNVNVALERVLSGCRATCFNISRCAGLGQTLRRHWWGLIWCKQWTLTPEWILQLLSLLQYHQTSHRQQHNSDPSEESDIIIIVIIIIITDHHVLRWRRWAMTSSCSNSVFGEDLSKQQQQNIVLKWYRFGQTLVGMRKSVLVWCYDAETVINILLNM